MRVVPAPSSTNLAEHYPMYVMPVKTLLEDCFEFDPHQDLLKSGKVCPSPARLVGLSCLAAAAFEHALV